MLKSIGGSSGGGGSGTGADPTASVGLTAVNGAAATFLRSDGAPALDVSIAPVWTNMHTFGAAGTLASPSLLISNSTAPTYQLARTSSGADAKKWDISADSANIFVMRTSNDANGAVRAFLTVTRSGVAVSNQSFGNATDNPTTTFLGTGMVTANGAVAALTFSPTSSTVPSNAVYLPAANTIGLAANGSGKVWVDSKTGVKKSGITISATERAVLGGVIYQNITTTGNTAATETDAFSHTITAATLGNDGETLEFKAAGTFAATASVDKRVKVVFGGTTLFDTGALAVTGGADWMVEGTIIRTGASTQKAVVQFTSSFASLNSSVDYTTPAETLSGAVTMKLTVNGTNASDTVAQFYKEEWKPFL